ncbi:MAG: hypothetical protein EZS28_038408 [Streblomastix strix]|uniref:PI31 proteasome regulator C-terminal domain-containing protein n=1 Tax=Streblomastix strix TaxID=222440 RepID=A0A5J4U713_9EUKA|nr:MAG: hypothetical protein EZS28_038408 [Streblomastix strix]
MQHPFFGPHSHGPQFGHHPQYPPFPQFPNTSVGDADRLPAGVRGQLDAFEDGSQGTEMGPNHPIFHGRGRGGWGGQGWGRGDHEGFFPPPGSIPPGARWDPVHPGQFPFGGRGGRGRGNAPGSEPFFPSPDDNMFI